MDTSDPKAPKIVHAFMPRDSRGYTIKETWDVLGMRATSSQDTILEGLFVPNKYIARVVPAGAAGIDRFVLGIFAWALLGFANIYYSLAQRALDLTIESVKKTSLGLMRSMAYHAEVQHGIAEAEKILDRKLKMQLATSHAVVAAAKAVELVHAAAGPSAIRNENRFQQYFRDGHTITQHAFSSANRYESVGALKLGVESDWAFFAF